ncbi:hypothetical protein JW926_11100 [Candidatus Sumerlaeota bacterium]|nr:hypothetical protein [Candidatus Sumerlaeota bacterium]
MLRKIYELVFLLILISGTVHAVPLNKPKPEEPPQRDYFREARLKEREESAEKETPLEISGTISPGQCHSTAFINNIQTIDLPLNEWTSNVALEFPPPRFSRNESHHLETKPNLTEPNWCYGFWSSPNFTISKPKEINNANSLTAYVEYSYTAVGGGVRIPSIRARFNRADFRDAAVYLYDGRNLDPDGGTGVITCKFDTNSLSSDQLYFLSVDFISFDAPVDPNYAFTITKAYVVIEEYPAPPEFIIDGLWVEDDYDVKAWINGYRIELMTWCYDAAYNDEIAVMIKIISEYWGEYDVYVWADDKLTLLNSTDTYQVAAAGRWACYLEQDGDVKAWNPFTDEFLTITDEAYRISSGGGGSLMIWDWDDELFVWIPGIGLHNVDDYDIWFLCDTTSATVY